MEINLASAANLVAVEVSPSLVSMSAPMNAGLSAISESYLTKQLRGLDKNLIIYIIYIDCIFTLYNKLSHLARMVSIY